MGVSVTHDPSKIPKKKTWIRSTKRYSRGWLPYVMRKCDKTRRNHHKTPNVSQRVLQLTTTTGQDLSAKLHQNFRQWQQKVKWSDIGAAPIMVGSMYPF
jgi:hypothetical protein